MKGKPLPLEVILSVFARVGRDEMLRHPCDIETCILSTRVAVEVLGRYGFKARALSVRTHIGLSHMQRYGIMFGGTNGGKQRRGLWKGFAAGHLIAVILDNSYCCID